MAFVFRCALTWVISLCSVGYFFGNLPVVKNNLTAVILLIVAISITPGIFAWIKARAGNRGN